MSQAQNANTTLVGDLSQSTGLSPEEPWPGLEAFKEPDTPYFAGRDLERDELLDRAKHHRLTVLYGLSGLGKTSLLQAGLFPKLREHQFLPVYVRLSFAPDAPGLVEQLFSAVEFAAAGSRTRAPLRQYQESPWEYFQRAGNEFWSERNRLLIPVLVFDQFEEIFTLGEVRNPTKCRDFMEALADLVEARAPNALKARLADATPDAMRIYDFNRQSCRIVLSLREDYLANLDDFRRQIPSLSQNRMRLHPFRGVQAIEVVLKPGRHLITEDDARKVVAAVAGRPGKRLPLEEQQIDPALISLLCRELNKRRILERQPQIRASMLTESERGRILGDFYERAIARVSPVTRRWVEERLLLTSGRRDSVAIETAVREGVTESDIDALVNERLLRKEPRGDVMRIEITHDVLTDVIRTSRDERREREAREEATQFRQVAEQAAVRDRNRALRNFLFGATAPLALLLYFTWKTDSGGDAGMGMAPFAVALTGVFPAVTIGAAVLAFVVSVLLLKLYRRAVLRSMRQPVGEALPPSLHPNAGAAPETALAVEQIAINKEVAGQDELLRDALKAPWRSALVYAGAGAAFATVMTVVWLVATRDATLPATKLLLLFWTYLWPAALTANLVAGMTRSARIRVFLAYFAILVSILAWVMGRNPQMGWHQVPVLWVITNGVPTVLVYAFLARPIRAVGPLVLSFMVVAGIGSQLTLIWLVADDERLRATVEVGSVFGLGVTGIFLSVFGLAFAACGVMGWVLLKWLGRRYQQKRFSDQSLMLDSLWLFFGVTHTIGLLFEDLAWVLSGLVVFAAYKLAALAGNSRLRVWKWATPCSLLILRVFSPKRRNETIFDALRNYWLRMGSISLVSTPDLMTAHVELREFLEFLNGRQTRQFVRDHADLQRRIAAMDLSPDPDGRYRVNEFFCREDTWPWTVRQLAAQSDAVLMDLRYGTPSDPAWVTYLKHLLDSVDLGRVVFLIDDATDKEFLGRTLQGVWKRISSSSPNRETSSPTAKLFCLNRRFEQEPRPLLDLLLAARPHATVGQEFIAGIGVGRTQEVEASRGLSDLPNSTNSPSAPRGPIFH